MDEFETGYEEYEASPYNGDDLDGADLDTYEPSDAELDEALDFDDDREYDDPLTYNEEY